MRNEEDDSGETRSVTEVMRSEVRREIDTIRIWDAAHSIRALPSHRETQFHCMKLFFHSTAYEHGEIPSWQLYGCLWLAPVGTTHSFRSSFVCSCLLVLSRASSVPLLSPCLCHSDLLLLLSLVAHRFFLSLSDGADAFGVCVIARHRSPLSSSVFFSLCRRYEVTAIGLGYSAKYSFQCSST